MRRKCKRKKDKEINVRSERKTICEKKRNEENNKTDKKNIIKKVSK